MGKPDVRFALCAITAVLGLCEASAAVSDVPPAAPEESHWTLRAGAEAGAQDSRAATASIDYAGGAEGMGATPSLGVSGEHSDASEESGGTVTTAGRAYFQYGTAALKGSIAFDDTSDQSFRHSGRWTGAVDFSAKGWSVQLNASTRQTRFDNFNVSTEDTRRIGLATLQSTTASCSLRDTGYGGSLTYNSNHWTAYVSGTGSHYDSIDCGYGIAVPEALQRLGRDDFQRLAGQFLNLAAARSGGRIGQDSRLLASLIGAGAAHHWDRFSLAFDYTRSTDEFGGAVQDGYALTGTMQLNLTVSLDLVTGVTTGGETSNTSEAGTTPYAGAYVTVTL